MRLYISVHVTATEKTTTVSIDLINIYIFFLPGVVQESPGEMAQKGEEQPAEYAGTRQKQWHYSQCQWIFRKLEFYSLRKLRDPTVCLS